MRILLAERAHIPFSSFDGSNFRDWKAKVQQFFELEGTRESQRSRLLLLCMDGKAFSWQRHYMQNVNNKGKSWQQILKDAGNKFDFDVVDDYLERFDTLFIVSGSGSEELALSFFLSGLTVELEKSVTVHSLTLVHEAIRIARLQDEVLQVMTHKFSLGKSFPSKRNVTWGSAISSSTRNYPITTLNHTQSQC